MTGELKEIVIPKEDAVFWMDEHGRWQNEHGTFEHAKIIDYFHSSIRRDEMGYFLAQERDGYSEKVYFRYEDTALFVFDVLIDEDITLVLNTKKRIKLQPGDLTIREDKLYIQDGEDRIKFAERGLLKIANLLEEADGSFVIRVNDTTYTVPDEGSTGEPG